MKVGQVDKRDIQWKVWMRGMGSYYRTPMGECVHANRVKAAFLGEMRGF